MIVRPRFRPDLHVEVVGDRVFLLAEGRHAVLSGGTSAAVASAIDGQRTTDQIVESLMDVARTTDIYLALMTLEKQGHIEETPPPAADGTTEDLAAAAFWSGLGLSSVYVSDRLAQRSVSVRSVGASEATEVESALDRIGVRRGADERAALVIVTTDDPLHGSFEAMNRDALANDQPWLLVRPNGVYPWLGPLFIPGRTGCWACLRQRLAANREVETYLGGLDPEAGTTPVFPPRGALAPMSGAIERLAAVEAARWLVTDASPLAGKVITLDGATLGMQEHELIRRPQCAACGDAMLLAKADVEPALVSRPKRYTEDGGHRSSTPEQMLNRYRRHVSPITGVAKSLVRITDPDDPIQHVYLAGSNIAARHDSFDGLRRHLRSACCGKGTTDEQAQASGLGEAIERYSGVFRGEEPRRTATFHGLGDAAIDPRSVMLYSEQQYADRERWNALERQLDSIPRPFDEDAELEWSPLWSLTRGETRYLPTGFCYYSYPTPPGQDFFLPESNGSAAGTSLEDAILQGFMELVERDSVAIWWYNRLSRPSIDLDEIDDAYVQDMRALHDRLGRSLWVLDLTSDLGIPAMIAISRVTSPTTGKGEEIVFAPAAHFDPALCLRRALTELNQMMPGLAAGADGDEYMYDDPEAVHWWRNATLENQPYLAPSLATPSRLSAIDVRSTDDLLSDIEVCRSIVEERGLEMLVLDQTRPDIGMPVAKVVVPGLRHFWARYAPGRLYDVPVAEGWLEAPTAEADLNPIPIFI